MNDLQARLTTNWENARKRRCRIGKVTPKLISHGTRTQYSNEAEWIKREMRRKHEQIVEMPRFAETPSGWLPASETTSGWLPASEIVAAYAIVVLIFIGSLIFLSA